MTLVVILTSCGEAPLTPELDQLRRNRARWAAQELVSYSFTYDVSCFCAEGALTPVRVRVVDADVAEVVSLENGEPIQASRLGFGHRLTVEGLFGFIEANLREHPHRVKVRYDTELGFPILVFLDVDIGVSDDEVTTSVRDFAAGVTDGAERLTVGKPSSP